MTKTFTITKEQHRYLWLFVMNSNDTSSITNFKEQIISKKLVIDIDLVEIEYLYQMLRDLEHTCLINPVMPSEIIKDITELADYIWDIIEEIENTQETIQEPERIKAA